MDAGRKGTCRLAILSIIEEEFDAVHAAFGDLQHLPGGPYWTTDVERLDLVATRAASRSNVPATLATVGLLENFRPEIVVVVGIGASVIRSDKKQEVLLGDVVVPDYLHYAEFGKIAEGEHLARYVPYDQPSAGLLISEVEAARVGNEWKERIDMDPPEEVNVEAGREWPRAVVGGSLLATEKILSDPKDKFQSMIIKRHKDAIAVDMESFGVARAMHDARSSVNYNPRLLILRGISDYVYEEEEPGQTSNQATRDKWKKFAAASASAFAFDVIGRILALQDERAELRNTELELRRHWS